MTGFKTHKFAYLYLDRALSGLILSTLMVVLPIASTAASSAVPTNGLQLWLAPESIVANGSSVSAWQDLAGHAGASQLSSSSQPALVSSCVAGQSCVRFDGSNSYLGFNTSVSGLSGLTLILVSSSAVNTDGAWNGTESAPLFWDETEDWGTVHLSPFQSVVKFRFGTGQPGNLPTYTRPSSIGTAFSVTTAIKNGSTETLFTNGGQVLSLAGQGSTTAGVSSNGFLGRGYDNTYFQGDIAEVLVYNRAISDSERQSIEAYLMAKYINFGDSSPGNQPPNVSAGGSQTITLPAGALLTGSATDDGLSLGRLSYQWTQSSGPGSVTFANANALSTTATFSSAGTYVLALTVSDGQLSGSAQTTVTVNAAPSDPPTVSSREVVYPANSGVLNVKNFGATGDGVSDDTAAIQSAVATALNQQGGILYFPTGTYLVSDTIWGATMGDTPAQATATIDAGRGCITGISVQSGGSGYQSAGAGVILIGGGGSGADVSATLNGDAISSISVNNGGCSGYGYTSAPTVKVVNWHAWLRFQGENQSNTTIRLKDNTPGFGNGNCLPMYNTGAGGEYCRAVLYFGSDGASNPIGAGEDGYANDVYDMTIDTGNGNAQAEGIDWTASNMAAIRNVTFQGSGRVALNTARGWGGGGNGPALVKGIQVNGSFDYGVVSGSGEVGLTFEHVSISNPNQAGFWNMDQNVSIRDLNVSISSASAPAVLNQGEGNMSLIDSTFTASGSSVSAILNQGQSQAAFLFARNISTSGFVSALADGTGTGNSAGTVIAGAAVDEFASNPVASLFGSSGGSLNLPISETPSYEDNDMNNWATVTDYGAKPNDPSDATSGIQAALNSGKPTVFFPYGSYKISATLHIPDTVRRIMGLRSELTIWNTQRANYPVFSCDATSGGAVEIRGFNFDITTVGSPSILNNCAAPLAITDVFNANGYQNTPGTGLSVYFENAAIPGQVIQHGGNAWARQLDIEMDGNHLTNDGANFWMLGFKTEGTGGTSSGMTYTGNQGQTEVLGALFSTPLTGSFVSPAFASVDSALSLSAVATGYQLGTVIAETKNGVTRILYNLNTRYGGTVLTLYSDR